jgi:hypothetical protein
MHDVVVCVGDNRSRVSSSIHAPEIVGPLLWPCVLHLLSPHGVDVVGVGVKHGSARLELPRRSKS